MGAAIGDILPYAVGIAAVPIPMLAMIQMLFSARSRENGTAFLVAWIIGIAAVAIVFLVLTEAGDADEDESASNIIDLVKLAVGIGFGAIAVKQWRSRPAPGEDAPLPGWMSAIETFTPVRAAGLALALSALNPKNIILAGGAGASIGQAGLSTGENAAAVAVFVMLSSLSVGVPLAYYLLGGSGARATLDELKAWLQSNNATVMTVLFLVLGVWIGGQGLSGLAS